jgi:polyisoprenoid-binding protein YceI
MAIIDHNPAHRALRIGTWRIDPVHSTVGLEVRDMAHLFATVRGRVTGHEGVVEATLDGVRASGAIGVASLTTDHAERDDNLRSAQFLDVAGTPNLRFEKPPRWRCSPTARCRSSGDSS